MSAESFIIYFGLRWDLDLSDEEQIKQLEQRRDPRQVAARDYNLDSWWGRTIDEEHNFLLLGK